MRQALCAAIVLGAPRVALACPVCFGQNDSPIAHAMNAGILFMLGVVVAMLAGFGSFIFYLSRRANMVDASGSSTSPGVLEAGLHVRSHPQEGTAQC
jgi:hypothetical protein